MILLQAVGGLVVAVVVKYADNILKGFAASASILTSSALCMAFFDFKPTTNFIIGAVSFLFVVLNDKFEYPPATLMNHC